MDERIATNIIKEHITNYLSVDERLEHQRAVGDSYRVYFDFYLPNGCKALGLNGAVAIEIKERLVSDTLIRLHYDYDNVGLSGLILIILDQREYIRLQRISDKLKDSELKGRNLIVYSITEFLSAKASPCYVENLIEKWETVKYEQDDRETLLGEIKQKIHNNSYTLFFGAGVSCSAGLPKWDSLLKSIMKNVIKQAKLSLKISDYLSINRYCYCSNSPLIMAQYMSTNLPDNELPKIVRKEIYRKAPNNFALLDVLVELVKAKRCESVVTYNYDDLFERRAESQGIRCRSISDDNRVEGDELPVYHVHGVLPQDSVPSGDEHIVLDEKSYHTENKDAFLWSNIEQMHALRRSTCIFVGLSMTDPNLRRLLDISQRSYGDEAAYHYAFLKKEKLRLEALEKNKENQLIIEKMLRGLGVSTVWYDNHSDLPAMISKLIV